MLQAQQEQFPSRLQLASYAPAEAGAAGAAAGGREREQVLVYWLMRPLAFAAVLALGAGPLFARTADSTAGWREGFDSAEVAAREEVT